MGNEDLSTDTIIESMDKNLLIELVKDRPVLWDQFDIRRRKASRNAAWEEVLKSLFDNFESYDNGRKTSLECDVDSGDCRDRVKSTSQQATVLREQLSPHWGEIGFERERKEEKDEAVRKKWDNLRGVYRRERNAGKVTSKYKRLDFLSKVFEEKKKRGLLFVSTSKEKNSTLVVDPDDDTQLNSSLQSRMDRAGYSQTGNQATSDRTPVAECFTVPARSRDGVNSGNVKDDSDSPSNDSDDEDAEDVKPHCSTTSIARESAQCNVRSGRKRRLEENKEEDGDTHYLQFVKKKLTKNFNTSQYKRFKSEILQLLDSVSNDFDDDQMEEFSIEMIKILLNKENDKDIFKHIIDCASEAERALDV